MAVSTTLIVFLAIGTFLMGVPILIVSKKYEVSVWKSAVSTIILTVVGAVGTALMYYVENRRFGGLSFYGAVFLVPIVFIGISYILRIPYGKIMDFCAVGECIMLALMKIHCMTGNCCLGRVLFVTNAGAAVLFPSRVVEMITAIIIFIVLMRWAINGKHRSELYIWYLILYGSTRFVLNFFRAEWQKWTGTIPKGTIWSLCAIMIGVIMLLIIRSKENRSKKSSEK